jgi:Tellurite resistance protein TerB
VSVSDPQSLKEIEPKAQLALAALLRLAVRLDGRFSEEEQHALEDVALELGEKRFWQVMDEAGRTLPDEESIRELALSITDTAAREAIFGAVLHVARSDSIQVKEEGLLTWLREAWKIEQDPAPYR